MTLEYNTVGCQKMNVLQVLVYLKRTVSQWSGLNVQMRTVKYGAMQNV